MLRKDCACLTTANAANKSPGALAGSSMARGGRVFLERLARVPEGVLMLQRAGLDTRARAQVQPVQLFSAYQLLHECKEGIRQKRRNILRLVKSFFDGEVGEDIQKGFIST